jgi:murein DD-endopeptidase MepM/ murein hydrolase activator NlpD
MQVFWVSGPVGRIRSFNLSFKTVVVGFSLLVFGLLATGSVLQFLGFRLALEYDPQIARRLGNLHTALEVESLNAVYHTRLGDLEAEHRKLLDQVAALQTTQGRLGQLLPSAVARDLPKGRAQGGLYLPAPELQPGEPHASSVLGRMDQVFKAQRAGHAHISQELRGWQDHLGWLEALPISQPVDGRLAISSGFGPRIDPFQRRAALHNGVDFMLPVGTPILAAGAGVVSEAGWDPQYGHTVVIKHQDGYASRYAHAVELDVKPGQVVERGQVIAKSGNSGRSTGPHLHFEIIRHGKHVDPAQYLTALASR